MIVPASSYLTSSTTSALISLLRLASKVVQEERAMMRVNRRKFEGCRRMVRAGTGERSRDVEYSYY